MKIADTAKTLIVGYLVIGIIVLVIQWGLSKWFEPPCVGSVQYTIREKYFSRFDMTDELQKTMRGQRDLPWYFGASLGVLRWLPDLYQEVIAGDMKVRDYLLGGYKCTPVPEILKRKLATFYHEQIVRLRIGHGPTIDQVIRQSAARFTETRLSEPTEKAEESIGVATMKDDGTIILRLRGVAGSGAIGEGTITYPPNHPEYKRIISHVGPIRPGQSVPVKPWPD